jgi:SnoaL-like domain
MERPNTVAGLIEKRRELVARLKLARDETRTLTCGIDAIDVVLKLFAPEIDGRTAKPMRLPIPHAAGKGEMQSIAFELLREPGSAISSRMLAERFCERRGLYHGDYKGGTDGFIEFGRSRTGGATQVMHFLGECLIEFASPTVAIVETYFITAHTLGPEAQRQYGATKDAGPVQLSHYGRYADRVEKRDGIWRIAHRVVIFEAS